MIPHHIEALRPTKFFWTDASAEPNRIVLHWERNDTHPTITCYTDGKVARPKEKVSWANFFTRMLLKRIGFRQIHVQVLERETSLGFDLRKKALRQLYSDMLDRFIPVIEGYDFDVKAMIADIAAKNPNPVKPAQPKVTVDATVAIRRHMTALEGIVRSNINPERVAEAEEELELIKTLTAKLKQSRPKATDQDVMDWLKKNGIDI